MECELFGRLEGRRSEDLVTEALAAVLSSSFHVESQKLFYELILRDGKLRDTEGRRLSISTQVADREQGRPDLRIEGDTQLVIVENKLRAGFSGDDQLDRYARLLQASTAQDRLLVLLCPRSAWEHYEHQAVLQFKGEFDVSTFGGLADALLAKHGIRFLAIAWEELVRALESSDFFASSLVSFVRTKFLRPSTFTSEELALVANDKIPGILQKIFLTVDRVREELKKHGVATGRMGQSYNYYGFWVIENGSVFWFGYMLPEWTSSGTPFLLQRKSDWEDATGLVDKSRLLAAGFTEREAGNHLSRTTQAMQECRRSSRVLRPTWLGAAKCSVPGWLARQSFIYTALCRREHHHRCYLMLEGCSTWRNAVPARCWGERAGAPELSPRIGVPTWSVPSTGVRDLEAANCLDGAAVICSVWAGYLDSSANERFVDWVRERGLPLHHRHTSGHASLGDLRRLREAFADAVVVPVHLADRDGFARLFGDVALRGGGGGEPKNGSPMPMPEVHKFVPQVESAILELLLEVASFPQSHFSEKSLQVRLAARLLSNRELTEPRKTGVTTRYAKSLSTIERDTPKGQLGQLQDYWSRAFSVPPLQMEYGCGDQRRMDIAILDPDDISGISDHLRFQLAGRSYVTPAVGIELGTEKSGWENMGEHLSNDENKLGECRHAYSISVMRNGNMGRIDGGRAQRKRGRIDVFKNAVLKHAREQSRIRWIGIVLHVVNARVECLTAKHEWQEFDVTDSTASLAEALRGILTHASINQD